MGRVNTAFKERLAAGEPTVLMNADHPSSGLVAALGGIGIDAIMIDAEQGNPSLSDAEEMRRAARSVGLSALVRVPTALPWMIERWLSRDLDGVVVPRLDTAAQAAQAIRDIEYCLPNDADDATIVVQIESVSAVEELDGFLALDRVDAYFIGAVDLAKSMGLRGAYRTPEAWSLIESVVDRIAGAGRRAGMIVTEADVAHWVDRGATLLYGHVNELLRIGARSWRSTAGIDAPHEDR